MHLLILKLCFHITHLCQRLSVTLLLLLWGYLFIFIFLKSVGLFSIFCSHCKNEAYGKYFLSVSKKTVFKEICKGGKVNCRIIKMFSTLFGE